MKHAFVLLSIPFAMATPPAVAQGSGDRDPRALAALERMGAALRAHQMVNVHADVTAEDALNTGEKLQYAGTVDIVARRPNAMKLSMRMGASERTLYYDGKTLTMAAPSCNIMPASRRRGPSPRCCAWPTSVMGLKCRSPTCSPGGRTPMRRRS